jgi:ABC-type nitrate/sulfonate/bicarbonate transport system permease component
MMISEDTEILERAVAPGVSAEQKDRFSFAEMPRWMGGAIGVVAIVIVWWLAAITVFSSNGVVPTPVAVVRQFFDDGWSLYWDNAKHTISAAVQSFVWGNLAAFVLAVMVLLVPAAEGVATQIAVISYCIPLTAIGPIILIVSDAGSRATSIFLAGLSVFFTTVVGCLLGWKAADRTSLELIRAYGGNRWTQLRKVQLIAALPNIFAALKIAAPAAFLGAILGEYFGGVDSGLGIIITAAQTNVRVAQIWSLAVLSGAIAGLGYGIVGLVAKFVAPWSSGRDDSSGGL